MLANGTRIDVRADLKVGSYVLAGAPCEGDGEGTDAVQSVSEGLAAVLPSWPRAYSAIFR